MPLLVPADVMDRHVPEATGPEAEARLQRAIAAAESQAAAYCGWLGVGLGARSLESTTRTYYLDAPAPWDVRELQLPAFPVASVTSIHDDTLEAYGASTLVDSGDYTLIGAEGRVRLTGTATHTWSTATRAIKVVCVAGWTPATAEDALLEALRRLSAQHYRAPRRSQVTHASRAGQTATYRPGRMARDIRQLLAPYRLPHAVGLGASGF